MAHPSFHFQAVFRDFNMEQSTKITRIQIIAMLLIAVSGVFHGKAESSETTSKDKNNPSEVQALIFEEEMEVKGKIEKPGVLYLIPQKREVFSMQMEKPDFNREIARLQYMTVVPKAHELSAEDSERIQRKIESLSPDKKGFKQNRSFAEALIRKAKER